MESLETETSYLQDAGNWLISNPDTVAITSTRGGLSQIQNFESGYYPDGLLQYVIRDPAGQAHRIVYLRDSRGNVVRVSEDENTGALVRTTDITYNSDHYFPTSITKHNGSVHLTTQVAFEPHFGQLATMATEWRFGSTRVRRVRQAHTDHWCDRYHNCRLRRSAFAICRDRRGHGPPAPGGDD